MEAVRGVSLSVDPGEVLCLLGESGSGKSVSMRALMRLLPPQAHIEGGVRVEGQDVKALSGKALRDLRGGAAAMVFQEPMTALDPVYTVGQQIVESVVRQESSGMELNRPDPVDGPVSGSVPGITSRSLGRRRQTRGGEGISWVQYF